MILVDTSIWIDHIREADEILCSLLLEKRVLMHPFIIGEVSLGHIRSRQNVLRELQDLPVVTVANDAEVGVLIERDKLHGKGVGYIDAHLITSTRLKQDAALWTRDKNLLAVADNLRLAAIMP